MRDMMNVAFQQSWFGPFAVPNVYAGRPPEEIPPGLVYNWGPLDGLKTTSMWAQWFSQIPLINPYQATPVMAGAKKRRMGQDLVCPPGRTLMRNRVTGELQCVETTSLDLPTAARTFPVRPFFGFQE